MQLNTLKSVFDSTPPFAAVYLEGRSPAEDAGHQLRLRWDDLRGRLEADGAGQRTLEAMDEALIGDGEDITEVHTDGRVLVADAKKILIDEPWDVALGSGDSAHLAEVPQLGPYVRERARSARLLVAVADQEGAVVRRVVLAEGLDAEANTETVVEGAGDGSVHKPREGALSHRQIQRRADEVVKQNARSVAEHLGKVASRWRPDALVLAGEIQGRTALADELPADLQEILRIAENGGVGDDGAEQALAEDLQLITRRLSAGRSQEQTDRFEEARAQNRTAEGSDAVALAAQMGAVETLLLHSETQARNEASLIAAAAGVDADVALTRAELPDHVAAILRFEAPAEIQQA